MKALTAQMSRLVYIFVVHIHENLGLSRQGPLLNHMVYLKCQHVSLFYFVEQISDMGRIAFKFGK